MGATGVGSALLDVLADSGRPEVTVLDVKAPPGPHTRFLATDLSDPAAVDAAIAQIEDRVDVLFNNAGVNSTAGIRTTIGFRMNSVCPAPIDTPLLSDFRKTMTDKVIDWNIAQAGGRLMSPHEVALPLAFLGSEAASYVSGVNFVVDGGFGAAMTTGQLDFSALA